MADELEEIVLYHANWCSHCKGFQPVWEEFKATNTSGVRVRTVEESAIKNEQNPPEIMGFPTVKLRTRSGKMYDYAGDRSVESLRDHTTNFNKYYSGQNGGARHRVQTGGVSMIHDNEHRERYYEMKYYKYKAKLAKLRGE